MAQRLSRPRRGQTDRNMDRRDQKSRRSNGAPPDSGKDAHRARGQGPRSKRRREKVTYRLCECRQDRAYAADWCCAWGCERGSRGSRRNHRRSRRNRLFAESAESVQSARSPNSERSGRRKSLKGRSRFSAPSAASCSRFGPWSTPTQLGASRLPDTSIASRADADLSSRQGTICTPSTSSECGPPREVLHLSARTDSAAAARLSSAPTRPAASTSAPAAVRASLVLCLSVCLYVCLCAHL